jgi:hypothetical protein
MTARTALPLRRAALIASPLLALTACGPREPSTDAERLARGRELVHQMSERLASVQSLSVSIQQVRDIVHRSGKKETISFAAEQTMQRPNHLHIKAAGERQLEGWYDGKWITIALHTQKLYAQAPMPDSIDGALDALAERYGYVMPVADLLYSSPEKALIADTTTGGYVGRETLDDIACHHLAFHDTGVDWELWLPVEGDPLPRRLKATLVSRSGKPVIDTTFVKWNLSPQLEATGFTARVPPDYEGIAMLQQAASVKASGQGMSAQPPPATPASRQ